MAKHTQKRSPFAIARYNAGYTQAEFAEVSGLSTPTVVRIEKRPWESSLRTLKKYIAAIPDEAQREKLAEWAGDVMRKKQEREAVRYERELAQAVGTD